MLPKPKKIGAYRHGLLWLDGRLHEIRDNLIARIAEARHKGWLGEVEGLRVSLASAQNKLAQIDRRNRDDHRFRHTAMSPPRISAD